jgi:hypothetical protein
VQTLAALPKPSAYKREGQIPEEPLESAQDPQKYTTKLCKMAPPAIAAMLTMLLLLAAHAFAGLCYPASSMHFFLSFF